LKNKLLNLSFTQDVYPSDANFLLAKMKNARNIYDRLCEKGIIVRDRSRVMLCDDCLRITIGTPEENKQLIEELSKYKSN
jgi:histidinol-phosphate aminotransferase